MRTGGHWGMVLPALLAAMACGPKGPQPEPPPLPDDVVLQVGPHEVTDRELNQWVDYARKYDPTLAPAFVRRVYLRDYVLPRKIVRTVVPADEVHSAEQQAERLALAVAQSGGTVDALTRLGTQFGLRDDGTYQPPLNTMTVDIAHAVFGVEVGAATAAVHSVTGSVVAGVLDERVEGGAPTRRLISVYFRYGAMELLQSQILERVRALQGQAAWVHPRYREELASSFREILPNPIRPQKK